MSKKIYRRHYVSISDDNRELRKILDKLTVALNLNCKDLVKKSLVMFCSKQKGIDKKVLQNLKKEQQFLDLRNAERDLRDQAHLIYLPANVNSRILSMLWKRSSIYAVRDYVKKSLVLVKSLDVKLKKYQKEAWDDLKNLGLEDLKDYQDNLIMLKRRGFTLNQIRKIAPDYKSFKESLKYTDDQVMIFKKDQN